MAKGEANAKAPLELSQIRNDMTFFSHKLMKEIRADCNI
jgi:hypothetical protein